MPKKPVKPNPFAKKGEMPFPPKPGAKPPFPIKKKGK